MFLVNFIHSRCFKTAKQLQFTNGTINLQSKLESKNMCFSKNKFSHFLKKWKREVSLRPIFIFNLITNITSVLITLLTQVQFTVFYTQTVNLRNFVFIVSLGIYYIFLNESPRRPSSRSLVLNQWKSQR